jgi:hypothetical protein
MPERRFAFQFVGRHLEEEMLVRAGHAYQTAKDWHRQHPGHPRFADVGCPHLCPQKGLAAIERHWTSMDAGH